MAQTFSVENFKGVREISLSPTGSLVVIAGGNGAGKSSFIDAFVELFDPKGTRLTPKPIRDGETEARAEFTDTDLGVRIVRTWKKDDAGKLEVFALDGAKYAKPAEVVASLTGGLIFDPVQFLSLDEKRQRDALLAKVDLPVDLDEVARAKAGAEERRRDAGREVKRLQGALSAMPKPAPGTPEEEVSAAALIDELRKADAHNNEIRSAREMSETTRRTIADLESRLAAAREALAHLEGVAARDQVDTITLRSRIGEVEETNASIRAAREYRRLEGELQTQDHAHADAQQDLDEIEERKREALAAAVFPVDGLSVDESGVTFDGVPFRQTNTATQRKVAFAIATAGDPKLKLVIVRDGDLLDADSLAAVREVGEERGYTVLVERDRDESREIGFTIEAGALA